RLPLRADALALGKALAGEVAVPALPAVVRVLTEIAADAATHDVRLRTRAVSVAAGLEARAGGAACAAVLRVGREVGADVAAYLVVGRTDALRVAADLARRAAIAARPAVRAVARLVDAVLPARELARGARDGARAVRAYGRRAGPGGAALAARAAVLRVEGDVRLAAVRDVAVAVARAGRARERTDAAAARGRDAGPGRADV